MTEDYAPAPPRNNTMKWVLGCSLGCLLVVILAVAAVGIGTYYATRAIKGQGVQAVYDTLKQQNKVPAEHQADLDRLVQLTQGENASMSAGLLTMALLQGILEDGVVSDAEATALQDAIQMLQANPDISMQQMTQFIENHPDINAQVQVGDPNVSDMGEEPMPEETEPATPDMTEPEAPEAPATTEQPAP